jgi:hypothetical protein
MCTFHISGEHRRIIELSLGKEEGEKFIRDTLFNHYDLTIRELPKRKGKSYTTVSRTIKHPKIANVLSVAAHCHNDGNRFKDLSPVNVSLKIRDLHHADINMKLSDYMTQQVEKHILGVEA